MLIAWGNVFPMAALSGVITLVSLLLYRFGKKELSLPHAFSLALVCGVGFIAWFTIFNTLSLGGLDQDLPIPFFPISPEDIGCAITVGLFVLLYEWLVSLYRKNAKDAGSGQQTELLASILPVIVALVVDVYFI
jgi:hypothetical protein